MRCLLRLKGSYRNWDSAGTVHRGELLPSAVRSRYCSGCEVRPKQRGEWQLLCSLSPSTLCIYMHISHIARQNTHQPRQLLLWHIYTPGAI